MKRGLGVLALMVVSLSLVSALDFQGCNGTVTVTSVREFGSHKGDVACNLAGEHRSAGLFGGFFKNEDLLASVGNDSLVIRLEGGVVVGAQPLRPRPAFRLTCSELLVQEYVDQLRWPDSFEDVSRLVDECDLSAHRLVAVPQVTAMNVAVDHSLGFLRLIGGYPLSLEGFLAFVADVSRVLFATHVAVFEFVSQFVGVLM